MKPRPKARQLSGSGVLASDIEAVWPLVRGLILPALEYADGKYTEAAIVEGLKSRQYQLWVAGIGALSVAGITTIYEYPGKKVCNLMFVGGVDMDSWLETIAMVEAWAASTGCESLEIWGRKGWERVLSDYDVIHTVIRKQL